MGGIRKFGFVLVEFIWFLSIGGISFVFFSGIVLIVSVFVELVWFLSCWILSVVSLDKICLVTVLV